MVLNDVQLELCYVAAWVHGFLQVYVVTELLTGGELLDALLERHTYSETDARQVFRQLLSGIAYLHGIVSHNDAFYSSNVIKQTETVSF